MFIAFILNRHAALAKAEGHDKQSVPEEFASRRRLLERSLFFSSHPMPYALSASKRGVVPHGAERGISVCSNKGVGTLRPKQEPPYEKTLSPRPDAGSKSAVAAAPGLTKVRGRELFFLANHCIRRGNGV
jgi:hypothetical protein